MILPVLDRQYLVNLHTNPCPTLTLNPPLTCQEEVGVRIIASSTLSCTYCRVHITHIDANDARHYALDEIDGGEAKLEAHQEELPSDATINR